jgi:RHH-type proline utilization regulon transcriptional repressor/proline dehydrogenase/delta 1-pyrroline-5-carboxylate dehydrogenase
MSDTQSQIFSTGQEILKRMEGAGKGSIFSKDFWYGSIMDWSMKNEQFKTQMFRFVDVLPSLNSGQEVASHLQEYFTDAGGELPPVFNVGLGLGSLAPGLMAGAIRKNVTQMAKMFITGENPQEALPVLKKARKNKIAFTVDILGEATLSENEALDYQKKYLELIDWLAKDAASWEDIPQIDSEATGPLPKVNVSVKMTALFSQLNDKDWNNTKTALKDRLRPVFQRGLEKNVFVNLDMEHYGVKHLTLEVFKELMLEPAFRGYPFFGCVIQAYLRDSFEDIKDLIQFAEQRGTPFTVRLVKGAYWDSETIEAEQKDWPIPVYTNKAESDANYEACAELLLKNYPRIKAAFGSHNVRSLAAVIVLAQKYNVPKEGFEMQMLAGMADSIKKSLVEMGFRVREYAPVGELIPGMAYLVRRLLENTSNESWLRGKFADGLNVEKLLADPAQNLKKSSPLRSVKKEFTNEALLDFAVLENRKGIETAIAKLRAQLPVKVPLLIQGQQIQAPRTFQRENPSRNQEIVAIVSAATNEHAEAAVKSAKAALPAWRKKSAHDRAALLDKLADLMKRDRFALIAEQVLEVGKPWDQADADVGEAIDFCRYYAADMRKLAQPLRVGKVAGENSLYSYHPRGITLVIAPWNFPLAILCGMATAAAVTGNTVIMKPAEQSSLVAWGLMKLMMEAGFPEGVVSFLPGYGEEVGDYLVHHPDIATIAFTGSRSVGLHIYKAAAEPPKVENGKLRQAVLKRCIIEMGGKNAIIVDSDADLDEAVDGVLYSAFGFAGQKCSACSRVIVLDGVYDKFVTRLKEATESLQITSAENPAAYLGPVVDKEAFDRIQNLIAKAKTEHSLIAQIQAPKEGYFVPPTIFAVKDSDCSLAQEEVFGPVLAVLRAKDMDHALQMANGTAYALTGGLFSRSPKNIERCLEEFEVGNLYINRGITGAMVDRHPFGGFKMSGLGSKTGGPDYLKQFTEPRASSENTMRRGFAPPETST